MLPVLDRNMTDSGGFALIFTYLKESFYWRELSAVSDADERR
jgi:hypothetical protein